MQVIEKYEGITYKYKTKEEFVSHKESMLKAGWEFVEVFVIGNTDICARYKKVAMTDINKVKDIVKMSNAEHIVIKSSFGKVLYSDDKEFLIKNVRISDRLLCKKDVLSYSEQNGILTVVVL